VRRIELAQAWMAVSVGDIRRDARVVTDENDACVARPGPLHAPRGRALSGGAIELEAYVARHRARGEPERCRLVVLTIDANLGATSIAQ